MAYSNPLTEQTIRAAVETWVHKVTADARPDAVIERLEPYCDGPETLLYIAHLNNTGFCICGGKYYMLPVYFYSPHRTYESMRERAKDIIDMVVYDLHEIMKENPERITSEFLPAREPYWELLASGRAPALLAPSGLYDGPDSMSLGNMPNWDNHQWYPFNINAPMLDGVYCDAPTPDGCTAHSMAMIMRYWEWPYSGTGCDTAHYCIRRSGAWLTWPLSFNPFPATYDSTVCPWHGRLMWSSASGGRLMMKDVWDGCLYDDARKQCKSMSSADSAIFLRAMDSLWAHMTQKDSLFIDRFDTVVYRWDLMPSEVGSVDTPEERYAVSKLTYNTGQATHMYFGIYGSSAGANAEAYESHFYYDTDAEWVELPRCNGVDTCNCPDDWCDPPGCTPDTCNCPEPDTCSGAKAVVEEIHWLRPVQFAQSEYVGHAWVIYGYNRLPLPDELQFFQDNAWHTMGSHVIRWGMVRRIAPRDHVKFVGASSPGDGTPDDPYQNVAEAIAESPSGSTLIFKAGSTNYFSTATLVIDDPHILRGRNAVIRRSY